MLIILLALLSRRIYTEFYLRPVNWEFMCALAVRKEKQSSWEASKGFADTRMENIKSVESIWDMNKDSFWEKIGQLKW